MVKRTAPAYDLALTAMGVQSPNGTANFANYYTIVDFSTGQVFCEGGIVFGYGTTTTRVFSGITIEMCAANNDIAQTYITSPNAGDVYYGLSTDMGADYCYIGDVNESNFSNYTHIIIPANTRTRIPLSYGSYRGRASFAVFKKQ